jgi:NAD(P)H-dependent FMN reductase
LIDLRDWPLPFFNEATSPSTGHYAPEAQGWAAKVAEGDGYVFITPEYNFGYPAVLRTP